MTKIPLIYSVSYFNFGGKAHQSPPWSRDSEQFLSKFLVARPE